MKGLIFTYLLTYGGAVASLFNPYYGLLIYVCFSIIKPEALWFWSVPAGNYSRIIAIALLIGWALNGFGNWQLGRAKPIMGFLAAFWVWQLVSGLQSDRLDVSLTWFEQFSKMALPLFVAISLINSVAQLKQLAWVIVVSHAYLAYEFNLSYYTGFNRLFETTFAGMDNNCMSIAFDTCIGLAFFLGFNASKWWQKAIAFGTVPLMINCVFFAFSRGGMLGIIISALISFVLIPKKPRHYFIFVLAVLLALRLAGPEVIERFATVFADKKERDTSAESRLELWIACVQIMGEKPIFGLGPRHFPLHAHRYGFTPLKEAHSLWLQIGAENGVIGLSFLLGFYGLGVMRMWTLARAKSFEGDPWFQDSARMVIASIAGFAISAQFVSLVGLEVPYYVILLGAGSLKLLSATPAPRTSAVPVSRAVVRDLMPTA